MNYEIQKLDSVHNLKRWLPTIIMLLIIIWLIVNRGRYTWIDNADLVIHEAGHFFFMFFGKTSKCFNLYLICLSSFGVKRHGSEAWVPKNSHKRMFGVFWLYFFFAKDPNGSFRIFFFEK